MTATVGLAAAVSFATAGIALYARLYPTVPPRHRLPLIRWLMTWPLLVLLVFAAPGRGTVSALFQALGR